MGMFLLSSITESANEQLRPHFPSIIQLLIHFIAFQMGMFLLSSITESANEQLRPHFPSLFQLFSTTLEDKESKLVPFYTIRSGSVWYIVHKHRGLTPMGGGVFLISSDGAVGIGT